MSRAPLMMDLRLLLDFHAGKHMCAFGMNGQPPGPRFLVFESSIICTKCVSFDLFDGRRRSYLALISGSNIPAATMQDVASRLLPKTLVLGDPIFSADESTARFVLIVEGYISYYPPQVNMRSATDYTPQGELNQRYPRPTSTAP